MVVICVEVLFREYTGMQGKEREQKKGKKNSSLNIPHVQTVNDDLGGFLEINMNQCISDQRYYDMIST